MGTRADVKNGWGKTIGVFFLCWFLSSTCCIISSLLVTGTIGIYAYSTGGLLLFSLSIIFSALYRSKGKAGVFVGSAMAIGVAIGLLVALFIIRGFSGPVIDAEGIRSTTGPTSSAQDNSDNFDYIAACTTSQAREIIKAGRDESRWSTSETPLTKVTFGCADGSRWELFYSRSLGSDKEQITSEEVIAELEAVAIAQMCGDFGEVEKSYVGYSDYGSEEEQIANSKDSIAGSRRAIVSARFYEIDGNLWRSTIAHFKNAENVGEEPARGSKGDGKAYYVLHIGKVGDREKQMYIEEGKTFFIK